ncbi:response regulator receiver protein [Stanieria cyanosphaera PCC 7437]|uniref:Response regulator receiver protein n=1 Tax=Stanieria cyanosphaera (strain ATCC 29371 / PCC 7437) TaxID=111780 RepID=K9XTD4_STAC7|nr:response regulator transcription factor [Stanieria cyanosphaera]AFZ34927.1 response regulator receiver protein [Stanieria cyanosphaera PCC 7437]
MIKVLIVDDQKTVQEILRSYIEKVSDLEIVGFAEDGQMALEKVELLRPDVVLMDIDLPSIDGLTVTKIICERFVDTKVIIFSVHDEDTYLNTALHVGAKGYLLKSTPPRELVNAIYSAYKGYFQLGPGLLERYLYKVDQAQSNTTEIEQLRRTIEQQSMLLERIHTSNAQQDRYQSSAGNYNELNQNYRKLEKQFNMVQYQFQKMHKQFETLQNFIFIFSVAMVIAIFIVILVVI